MLLKEGLKRREDEEEDVISYSLTLWEIEEKGA